MKYFILAISLGLFSLIGLSELKADQFIIPFGCYPKELQQKFADRGKKVDLRAEDRTPESWAILLSEGNTFRIYTYQSAGEEDFNIIKAVCLEEANG